MLVLADYLVIALYFGGTAALLLSATRGSSGQRSAKEFFLGDGRLPGWALGVSLLGTTVSSVTFLAFPAYTLERDLRLLPKDAALLLIALPAAAFLVPKLREGDEA